MRLDKLIGAIVGIGVLLTVFLAPFSSAISVIAGAQETLYAILRFFLGNLGSIPSLHSTSLELIAYFYLVGSVLLIVAGILGSFPLLSSGLGFTGLALVTITVVLSPRYSPSPVIYGFGFYLLWGLLVIQIVQFLFTRWGKLWF